MTGVTRKSAHVLELISHVYDVGPHDGAVGVTAILSKGKITKELISEHLSTKEMPDPELLIRTSGEHRVSNFLLWQIAYAELYFTEVLWPDFKKEDLYNAVYNYQKRERRFGRVSEQLEK